MKNLKQYSNVNEKTVGWKNLRGLRLNKKPTNKGSLAKSPNKRQHKFILPLTMELSLSSSSLRASGTSPHYRKSPINTKCKFFNTLFKCPDNSTLTTNFYCTKRSSKLVSNKYPKQFSVTVCLISSISSWINHILLKLSFTFSKYINFTWTLRWSLIWVSRCPIELIKFGNGWSNNQKLIN